MGRKNLARKRLTAKGKRVHSESGFDAGRAAGQGQQTSVRAGRNQSPDPAALALDAMSSSASPSPQRTPKDRPKMYRIMPGQQYGRLTVIRRAGRARSGCYLVECLCSCGSIKAVRADGLVTGSTRSCGCLRREHCYRWLEASRRRTRAAAIEFLSARPVEPLPVAPGAERKKLKVTQAFTRKQRISGLQHEGPPWSPGNRYSGLLVGHQGKRSSTEHAVSEANPRTGTT
jgi:hypothetical protein